MVFNNILEYYFYLGQVDKKSKNKKQVIKGYNKVLVKNCQDSYNKGFKK